MQLIGFFALIGMSINDLLAIFSVIGSLILFLGAFSKTPLKKYGDIANYSILGLVFGALFQISMAITNTTPQKIGILIPISPALLDGLLFLSLLLLIGRWWIRKTKRIS
ncbi:hypothetical protein [Candidatus Villigracilis saccharophilus]|uniref:hypothetical protein n=1 Tax=Candidatus Villigracilis saccharophilus TaxID=3140684 RepID=UPI003136B588|nr:hypothetical protein [Anaerolineales bacterium]